MNTQEWDIVNESSCSSSDDENNPLLDIEKATSKYIVPIGTATEMNTETNMEMKTLRRQSSKKRYRTGRRVQDASNNRLDYVLSGTGSFNNCQKRLKISESDFLRINITPDQILLRRRPRRNSSQQKMNWIITLAVCLTILFVFLMGYFVLNKG